MPMRRILLAILLTITHPNVGSLRASEAPPSDRPAEKCCCCERGKCLCGCERPGGSENETPASDALCICANETPLPTAPFRCNASPTTYFVGHLEGAILSAPRKNIRPQGSGTVHDPPSWFGLVTTVMLI